MWVRQSSIRPVPSFARIPRLTLDNVRDELLRDSQEDHGLLDDAFERFEESQPAVSEHVARVLGRTLSEPTIALGFFLSLAVWLAFEQYHGTSVRRVGPDELKSTKELVSLDETLRQSEPNEALETVDVIAMEQPALVEFIHEQMAASLELPEGPGDADELQLVYRMVLIEVLALSYAVKTPTGFPVSKAEALA